MLWKLLWLLTSTVGETEGFIDLNAIQFQPVLKPECKLLLSATDTCDVFLFGAVIESGHESSTLR